MLIGRYSYQFDANQTGYSLLWHPTLNQMAVGMKDGFVNMLYDNEISVRGAVMVEGRTVSLLMNMLLFILL